MIIFAAAAIIALIIEDIFVFASGGESAIGELIETFSTAAQKPGAHWIVVTLNDIFQGINFVIQAWGDFFKVFGTQAGLADSIFGGFVNTISMAGEGVILFFTDVFKYIFLKRFVYDQLCNFIHSSHIYGCLIHS